MTLKAVLRASLGKSLTMRAALGAALALAGIAAVAAPSASAANRGEHVHAASVARFHVTGIVSAVNDDSVNLFVENGVVAGRAVDHEQLTVRLGRARIHEIAARDGHFRSGDRTFAIGEVARFSGAVLADGSSNDLWAQTGSVTQTPVIALVGTVYETGGSLVIVDRTVFGRCDQVNSFVEPVVVDDSSATITLDGSAATGAQIAAGQTVIVLGTNVDGTVLAASIYAFSTAPTIATGILRTVSGTTLAITPFGWRLGPWSPGGSNNDSMPSGPFLVDASSAVIVLNGVAGSAVSDLAPGDAIVAVGPSGSSPLAASVVFAFDQLDLAPLTFFGHHHGHGGQWWSGQVSGTGNSGSNSQGSSD